MPRQVRFAIPHRSASLARFGMEPLERRSLLSATISGMVMQDLSGNGLSPDDIPLSGVVVKLYRDVNGNGALDAPDGAAIASRTSAANGTFSFTGLAIGQYLLQNVPAANQVRTAPALSDTLAVNVTKKNGVYGSNTFANYVKDFNSSFLSNISYTINGTRIVTTLLGNVNEGDTVTANFTVNAGKVATLSLVSYKAPAPTWTSANMQLQAIFDVQSATFSAGRHSLTVKVPNCYFQVDFVGGLAIDRFGPAGSNILYSAQGRLISYHNGGTRPCDCDKEIVGREGLTPGFWKNHPRQWVGYSPTQTLSSVFNIPSSLGLGSYTLMDALNFGGGGGTVGAARNLLRQAVAAILNARHPLVEYAWTSSNIISSVNNAIASGNAKTIEQLKDQLDRFNNGGGGIDAHGNPI